MSDSNIIASRIADFLKKFPPFSYMTNEELEGLSKRSIVKYGQVDDFIFKQDDEKLAFLYVVKEGAVQLEEHIDNTNKLVDICDEGDVFGVRAMLTDKPYVFDARCVEESLIYGLPIDGFRAVMECNSKIALFFASGLAGGQGNLHEQRVVKRNPFQEMGALVNWNRPLLKPNRTLITAFSETPIAEVATLMTKEKIGSIVICDIVGGKAIGIVTDTDFKTKVATGKVSIELPVGDIMSTHLITMPLGKAMSAYLLEMLRHKIHHICLTDNDLPVGILSSNDLAAAQQNHPVSLVFAMEETQDFSELIKIRMQADSLVKLYLEQDVSTVLTAFLTTHINDTLIAKTIELALATHVEEHGEPPVSFCWLSLGSEGRSEQILRTDQDNALIYQDVEPSESKSVHGYFNFLAKRVNRMLEQAGFVLCPADMMAGNERWCQPLSQWKKYFSGWIHLPQEQSLMMSTIFFDFRMVFGDQSLIDNLNQHLKNEIGQESIFINYLAKNSLQNPPPLSFFKNLIIERSGEHRDEFDLKARAMMPLVDAARVLTLAAGIFEEKNTIERYRLMEQLEPNNAELYRQAAESYEYLLYFRAVNGFKNNDSGRFIKIDTLSKLDRQILRNTFEPIHLLQNMFEVRYQLNYFN